MNMELLENIFKWVSATLSLLVFLFTASMFVINKIKQKHKRITAEEKAEELEGELNEEQAKFKLLNEILPLAIVEAEKTPLINGVTKKMLALSHALLSCNTLGINFEHFKDFINEQIENLIKFTKVINPRNKDVVIVEEQEKAE